MRINKILIPVFLICFSEILSGQKTEPASDKPISITGKVYNQNREPVAGAVIYVDNLKTSNITRNDGSFKIKVSPSAMKLEVRSDEYGVCETLINGQTSIIFNFKGTDSDVLHSVDSTRNNIVTVTDKHSSGSKAKKMNTYNNIYQMIRAEVTGVMVNGTRIQIRQGHSFFGSGSPLFVVNGVIVSTIDNINPVEVKSIRVLAGSEAAIYGVNGSNGVLSITLKNGSDK
jgi:TonB-dependent starch-binding outer membrane protein SusC